DERSFAEDALRLADQEMDLAFAQAVRATASRPPAATPESKEASARLSSAVAAIVADSTEVAQLTAARAKASAVTLQTIDDRLNLARAQAALDQDEVDDARADLIRSGGDPQGRMQAMVDEHDAASRASDSVRVNLSAPAPASGLIGRLQALQALYNKEAAINAARASADSLAVAFKQRHDRMEARAAARVSAAARMGLSHDSSAALLAATRRSASSEKSRATLDQRVDNQRQLSDVYAGWAAAIGVQETAVVNRALEAIAAILLIILVAILLARWIEHALGARSLDRRQTQTLYMVTRVSLQVIAVLLILLVVFGPPDNLGTFLGLAGAGLTVALKDFIVAFVGWFVLMGKNGIRIGDLVEVNGVTGEVVELGMFYTALLETGNWTEAGHPTGRRVSFTNGFAIEGHYFNFSTSGQWLWDEVRIVVPAGRDPYPIIEALNRVAGEATAASAREAEEQLKGARRAPRLGTEATAPSVTLKPVGEGVEVTVRYITRVAERAELRARLYHTAVECLGGVTAGWRTPSGAPVLAPPKVQA
ncbi:MAG TPA: mechanosensitive ion channel domain-containing protein, partial [Gemmatimonadaceae bacterium]|nr:mechanosensitive ion channel domain-containing protein [Gemmatimonadaceae bacterium]